MKILKFKSISKKAASWKTESLCSEPFHYISEGGQQESSEPALKEWKTSGKAKTRTAAQHTDSYTLLEGRVIS